MAKASTYRKLGSVTMKTIYAEVVNLSPRILAGATDEPLLIDIPIMEVIDLSFLLEKEAKCNV